jgi:hypothetical protein
MAEVHERTGIRYHSVDYQHRIHIGSLYHDMAKASIPWVFQLRADCMLATYQQRVTNSLFGSMSRDRNMGGYRAASHW